VGVNGGLIASDDLALDDAAAGDGEFAERSVLILHGEVAFGSGGDEIDLACREVGDIGRVTTAEAVALLRFLAAEFELGGEDFAGFEGEVYFHAVGAGHGTAELLGIAAYFLVIHGETGVENDFIDAVEGGTAKAILFGKGGQRGSGREGGDAEDDVVVWIDIALQTEAFAGHVCALVGHIQIAAAGLCVGEHFAALEDQLVHDAVVQTLVKVLIGAALDGAVWVIQEGHVFCLCETGQVNEDADAAAKSRLKHGVEQAVEVELRELASAGGRLNGGHGGGHHRRGLGLG